MKFLSEEFLKKYEGVSPPLTELGEFVYLRTYSRWVEALGRRENWAETITRTIDYSIGLELKHNPRVNIKALTKEAEELFDNMFNQRQYASGRTMWVGNTEVAEKFPISNFNCSFLVLDSFDNFSKLFYLLMIGSGVGFRTMPYDVEKLSTYRANVELVCEDYKPVPKKLRKELTNLEINESTALLTIGDSKEGWVSGLDLYFKIMTSFLYNGIDTIRVNFNSVRPKGSRLKRFGGTSSGHQSLQRMFEKTHKVMKSGEGKLKPIDVLDIGNIIGENVVSGGVRRTAEINISSAEETDIEYAKSNLYYQNENGDWVENKELLHRMMSNNSIFYENKPLREKLHQNFLNLRRTGERGFINAEAGRRRRKDFSGMNPCAEILLANFGLCNLTTVQMMAFIESGKLNKKRLYRAFELSARIGVRMSLIELEIPEFNEQNKKDRLIGCSMTGFYDMVDAVGMSIEDQKSLLKKLKFIVRETANSYAKELGINEPLLATTIKPEGTISQLFTSSSGIHRSHSPYFIRRVRISATDPLFYVIMDLGYPIYPEVGQEWGTADTYVVEFPVKSPAKRTKNEVGAIEQLETYKMFQEDYTEHNTSITVTVRENEWDDVEEWVWNNWDTVVAVSFLSLNDHVYKLAPYEEITEEEYLKRKSEMKPFDSSLLAKYEKVESELDMGNESCEAGVCPIR